MGIDTGGIEGSSPTTILDAGCEQAGFPRLLKHLQQPEHLLIYLVFTAWAKYMDILSWLPTISIG